jgi:DNA mismatch repair protein MutS
MIVARTTTTIIARLDCTLSLAALAVANSYVRPTIQRDSQLSVLGGRHALRELRLPLGAAFVPNCASLDDDSSVMVLSGPNFR